jgi:hypothetical protein
MGAARRASGYKWADRIATAKPPRWWRAYEGDAAAGSSPTTALGEHRYQQHRGHVAIMRERCFQPT